MPWPEKQRRAIFLNVKRKKGEAAAERVMHEAGYGKKKLVHPAERRMKLKRALVRKKERSA
jgi:hypothetical protein